jgi:hypothetical protein
MLWFDENRGVRSQRPVWATDRQDLTIKGLWIFKWKNEYPISKGKEKCPWNEFIFAPYSF